ncbi:MAG: hypothetical protein U0Q11_05340 [Vicinamibacterales bacterium]
MRLLFSFTAFLGAFLLFLVEPLFARLVLPLLGGAPAVWNTCLVFYQCALLIGYLYAHGISRRPLAWQASLQVVLLIAAALALPIAIKGGAPPSVRQSVVGWVLWILVLSIGVPFVVFATTGPLLQRWYSLIERADAGRACRSSRRATSEASSPSSAIHLVVEPLLRTRTQSVAWAVSFGVYAVAMVACGFSVWRFGLVAPAGLHLFRHPRRHQNPSSRHARNATSRSSRRRRLQTRGNRDCAGSVWRQCPQR